jgi:penicillin-binding protein 1C
VKLEYGNRWLAALVGVAALGGVTLWILTLAALQPQRVSHDLLTASDAIKPQVLDRHGRALTVTYQNPWNLHDRRALHDIPVFLQRVFVLAEDKSFDAHAGVDWNARLHALGQNLAQGRIVRGASTITEQVVRMRHPRTRTFWSRWLEGWEAQRLEKVFSKADILEFYLNQVPYAANRRGVVQAARHYFDRDLDTLDRHEMLALAVLVRAPGRLDPRHDDAALQRSIDTLARRALETGLLSRTELEHVSAGRLDLRAPRLPVEAHHFVEHVYRNHRLAALMDRNVQNAALLVVDHHSDEILAWVASHNGGGSAASWYDPVLVPRQPGSTLKPFLYATALEKGWTAATLIDDAPLAESVLWGLHDYRNYSRRHYGPVRLRDALGNSLNIPAVKAVQHVGSEHFLERLNRLGVQSLRQHPNYYGDGLALGNGEMTLLELVGAYATLARHGVYRPLRAISIASPAVEAHRVFSPEASSLVADILSDPDARKLEFGRASLLQFPVQTAVKTGTSSDYRDAWAVGFNHRYTVGVWMGNLNDQGMDHVTGARGPVLVLRTLFAELNRHMESEPLYRSEMLVKIRICRDTGLPASGDCPARDEWFRPDRTPLATGSLSVQQPRLRLRQPSNGLLLAMDPRIPDELEAFEFILEGLEDVHRIEWYVDGRRRHAGKDGIYLWPLERGAHTAWVKIWSHPGQSARLTPPVRFLVK